MNLLLCLQRASLFGVAALGAALFLQWVLANRVPASWRVWIWRVALVQTALALIPLSPLALAVLPARAPITTPKTVEAPPMSVTVAPALEAPQKAQAAPIENLPTARLEAPSVSDEVVPQPAPVPPRFQFSWRATLLWIYLLGIAVQLALFARSAILVRCKLRACTPLESATLKARLHALTARLNIARAPRLLQSGDDSPFLVGLFRPTIVLPAALNEAHLDAVLAHELAHQRRKDLAWNTFLWALQTLLWFHPLSWVSRRFHALEVESACDELTLKLTRIAPKSYGALLIGAESSQPSALTAGVNDNFFALQTRLARLGRAPMQPRRRVGWILVGALLLSFGAVVPIELTARAQNETEVVAKAQSLRGTVRDFNGKPVAGATVYVMDPMDNGGDPRAQTRTDANGKFALNKLKIDQYGVVVFVDAGRRGVTEKQFDSNSRDDANNFAIQLPKASFVNLLMADKSGRRIKGVEVRLFRVGNSFNSWMAMPRAVKARYHATTDAVGIAVFPPLPLGMLAQFELADEISKPTQFGWGDLRGGKYAPLAAEDAVRLNRTGVMHSIILVPSVQLEGRVTLEDGSAKGNVLILARRINAAEAAGKDVQREQLIAQTRSNAQGKYVMDGLRPGRYYVWVYPEKQLVKDYIGPSYERDLNDKTNRVDFKLSRGAIIQGVVVSKNTGKPVKGQTMWLFDSQENNQYAITDARGYFKFRALGGKQRLRVHANGSNSPPPGFRLPAQSEFNFTIQNGQKRDFKIALLGQPLNKPTSGVIVGPDKKPVAGAKVVYRMVGSSIDSQLHFASADKNGRFALPMKWSAVPTQLWADADAATTPGATIAAAGATLTLQLQSGAWSSVSGHVLDQSGKAVAGAQVSLFQNIDGNGINPTFKTVSDAQGRYQFERLRPGLSANVKATKTGYAPDYSKGFGQIETLQSAENRAVDIAMLTANRSLAGRIWDEAGKPAAGYRVSASGSDKLATTDKNGRFALAGVTSGGYSLSVSSPRGETTWNPFPEQDTNQTIKIRLRKAQRFSWNQLQITPPVAPAIKGAARQLVGQSAPAIRASQWSNGKALSLTSLRGQIILLAFDPFVFDANSQLRDFARSFAGRIVVLGVQQTSERSADPRWEKSLNQIAKELGFPIAVDAALPAKTAKGWQTFSAYGNAPYIVIGRDGKVVYAGNKLDRAIELATAQ